jgi:flagella basal body P-ring formation protein FlgA
MMLAFLAVLCVAVAGPEITAGDLAKAEPVFTPADPNAHVAYAPTPGVRRIMHPPEVNQLLKRLEFTSDAPLSEACFERPLARLSVDAVTAAMRKALGPEARLQVSDLSAFPVPVGELVFPLEDLGQPPVELWRGYVLYDGVKQFRVWAHVKVSVAARHLIALEDLKPGVPIKLSQLAFQSVEEFPQKRVTPASLEQMDGALPRRFIHANSPVWTDSINPPLDIAKGDRVAVTVNSGLARISIDAEAATSGRRGDLIALKNLESGKLFRGRIDAPGKAALEALR